MAAIVFPFVHVDFLSFFVAFFEPLHDIHTADFLSR